MDSFNSFYRDTLKRHRHRGSGFTDTSPNYTRKRQNIMPDMFKKDLSKNQKIEMLKTHPGTQACTSKDLEYIRQTFNIIPDKSRELTLGKTGIKLTFNPQTNTFMLRKK